MQLDRSEFERQGQLRMPKFSLAVAQSIAAPGDVSESVRRHVRLASLAAGRGARLVLFPELSLTGYDRGLTIDDALAASDPRLQPLQSVADAHDMVIVAGAPIASSDGLHIAAMSFVPGTGVSLYLKKYLHEGEEDAFIPGRGGDPLVIGDQVVGLAICADITHSEHAREMATCGCTIYAASCFLTEQGYEADVNLLHQYAREHGMTVLMANYGAPIDEWSSAGRSAIWSDNGALLARAPAAGESLVISKRSQEGWYGCVVECPW